MKAKPEGFIASHNLKNSAYRIVSSGVIPITYLCNRIPSMYLCNSDVIRLQERSEYLVEYDQSSKRTVRASRPRMWLLTTQMMTPSWMCYIRHGFKALNWTECSTQRCLRKRWTVCLKHTLFKLRHLFLQRLWDRWATFKIGDDLGRSQEFFGPLDSH